jgi:hypothetical protein
MKKVIKLTEADLNKLIQKVLMETVGEEPIISQTGHQFGKFIFHSGQSYPFGYISSGSGKKYTVSKSNEPEWIKNIADFVNSSGTYDTIKKYYRDEKYGIPKFIKIDVGTSVSGTKEQNADVAQKRYNFLTGLIAKALRTLAVGEDIIKQIVINCIESGYKPTGEDLNFSDKKRLRDKQEEMYAYIEIYPINVKGLKTGAIQNVQRGLNSASSMLANIGWVYDGVEAQTIVNEIKRLQTYSDIQDLNNTINAGGKWNSLEEFLNEQLQSHSTEMKLVAQHLMKCAVASQKQKDTVRMRSYGSGRIEIIIGLNN